MKRTFYYIHLIVLGVFCTFFSLELFAQPALITPWTVSFEQPVPILDKETNPLWKIEFVAPTSKMYTLSLTIKPANMLITGEVLIDGLPTDKFKITPNSNSIELAPLFFDAGTVSLELKVTKGKMELEKFSIRDSLKIHVGPPRSEPINPATDAAARKLLQFLAQNYGRHIISGQQDLTWDDSIDMTARVKAQTGREPAIMGYDFLCYVRGTNGNNGLRQIEEAISWSRRGGIVAFCWHWRAGQSGEFYTKKTDFRIPSDKNSAEWQSLIRDIDSIAIQLKRLQDAGVPVLWRPLHEASGAWFWWGASGPGPYKLLWKLLYERLVNVHHLNNLIWVWNGQNPAWYPGDDTVDIVGLDIYGGERMYESWKDSWVMGQSMVEGDQGRIIAMTENGPIPDPDKLIADKVPWSWFMTWNDGNKGNADDDYFSGDKYMDAAFKKKVFNHEYVLTLDELPDLKP